jgi:PAT family beta-lactamase induction signal transducer AmpG
MTTQMPADTVDQAAAKPSATRLVPTLYVLQGMPYFVVQAASNTFLTAMGAAPSLVGKVSSDLTLPWMLKPLWSPVVDLFGTKRRWVLASTIAAFIAMAVLAWATNSELWLEWTIAACVLLAFASATYDIACDGYYMLALPKQQQELYVGVRNACYRLGRILVTGGAVALAGLLQATPGQHSLAYGLERPQAWCVAIGAGAFVYGLLALYLSWIAPRPATDQALPRTQVRTGALAQMVRDYVQRPRIWAVLLFILFYRFGESMLTPMIAPFLLKSRADGGLGLTEAEMGLAYGTIGVIALLCGGVLGGWLISRVGLWRCLWPMAVCVHLPNVLYAWAAHAQPDAMTMSVVIGIEQFGYGFGFTAYMVYLLQFARGSHYATTHYAISTGLMGLSAWLAGRWSGSVVEALGFEHFFWLVVALGLLGILTLLFLPQPEAPHAEPKLQS